MLYSLGNHCICEAKTKESPWVPCFLEPCLKGTNKLLQNQAALPRTAIRMCLISTRFTCGNMRRWVLQQASFCLWELGYNMEPLGCDFPCDLTQICSTFVTRNYIGQWSNTLTFTSAEYYCPGQTWSVKCRLEPSRSPDGLPIIHPHLARAGHQSSYVYSMGHILTCLALAGCLPGVCLCRQFP